MRPSNFEYQRAGSVAEAVQLLANHDGAKALAGGHSLIPAMNLRLAQPDALVDIGRLSELKGIQVSGGKLLIGALTTHAEIAASAEVHEHCHALAMACGQVGDPMVRNRGTLGGNIAHADPASDPPTVILAMHGVIHTQGPDGTRAIPAADFFVDVLTTDLAPGELITHVEIPSHASQKCAYVKFAHTASRYAVVGIAVLLDMNGNTCNSVSVAVGGCVPKATISSGAEAALTGKSLDDATLEAAAHALMDDIRADAIGDVFAPEAYRVAVAGAYLKRAIHAALSM